MSHLTDSALATFFEACACTTWTEDLWTVSLAFFRAEGVERFAYHHMPPLGAPDMGRVRVVADGFPEDWVRLYTRRKYYRVDPIPMQAMATESPFWWSEIRDLREVSRREAEFLARAEAADLGDGLAVQAFGPGGRNGYFALGLPETRRDISAGEVRWFQAAAQIAHLRYCRILRDTMPPPPVLSERERELLHWVAQGKSNSVIAEIMDISPHTVDAYLRRAFLKLGASDRISAAVRGLSLSVIQDY